MRWCGIRFAGVIVVLVAAFIIAFTALSAQGRFYPVSYWLWAGITAKDAPASTELYIYQGLLRSDESGKSHFQRNGLYPHPVSCTKLFLVYRLEGVLPDIAQLVALFEKDAAAWQRHSHIVNGVQLDFDSPTSKLLAYSDYLRQFREALPQPYALSITGLGDWAVHGNRDAMQRIAASVDEIVFQLYQDRHELPDMAFYIAALQDYPLPFKVGQLQRFSSYYYAWRLYSNPRFNGVIYFIQK